jgi:hypothetical protein
MVYAEALKDSAAWRIDIPTAYYVDEKGIQSISCSSPLSNQKHLGLERDAYLSL